MFRFLKHFILIVFACSSAVAFAQNEAKKWYFGNYCALDFSTNPPSNLANGAMATEKGCASAADASGNLLFYTNGVKIWNKSHLLMANGNGLLGDPSSSQGALIVKQPGSSNLYFVFTSDGGSNGLNYSVVDLSLAAGLGSVTVKNSPVYANSSERLCGTKHCNGNDVWVISHDSYSTVFRANLVTAAGVDTSAVLSPIGTGLNNTNLIGCMKVSPNGKKLGTALSTSFELFDFNTASGVVSNSLSLPVNQRGYGCEFSPDGTKFYGTVWGETNMTNRLRQWDLCAGSGQAIAASSTTFNATHTGQIQLAPDGKIYQARATVRKIKVSPELYVDASFGEPQLGVIHNPNAASSLVNFNNTAQAVNPSQSMFGLPNFISGFYKTTVAQFSYSLNPAVSCVNAFFTAPPLVNATCSASSYTIDSVKWLFGDAASGPANTSTLLNPQHQYPNIGTYNVRLVLYNVCGGVIDTLKQQVVIGGALLNAPSSLSVCSGQSLTLIASGQNTYTWSTGATANSIVVSPSVNTTYSLSFSDSFGCQYQSVETVTVYPAPTVTVTGKDSICTGSGVAFKASGALTYSWSTGSTNSAMSVTPAVTTAYTLTGGSVNGCSVNKVFTVVVKPAPVPVITGNTLVCEGSVATAVAQGNDKFVWNNGTKGATLTVVPDWNLGYIFSVFATYTNGCTRYQRIWFHLKPLPDITVSGTTTLCLGSAVTLTAGGANTYTWSNGLITKTPSLAPIVTTAYTVTGADTNKCVNTATVLVRVNPSSPANAFVSGSVVICAGESAILSASGGEQFNWKPQPAVSDTGNYRVVVTPSATTIYSVTISTDNACATTKTVEVFVNPNPGLWAGRDTVLNLDEPMIITASGTGSFTWTGSDGTGCTDCRSMQIFPSRRTCYQVQAINKYGCTALDEVCVDVTEVHNVYIPTAFTPNGDGLNDELIISGFGITEMHLSVFDRWGEKIFSSNSEKTAWNGSYRGKPCLAGNYNWLLDYVSANGTKHQKTGYVSLMR